MTKIKLNGDNREIDDSTTITILLSQLDIPKIGTAVAINSTIISRDTFSDQKISEGDSIDILRAIGGG
ncbi:MAG: sulfur carrier protein ThiS [Deltaproteobacteria bacterium]|jgi:sulfur carrier protein|nr:sulfur carrier protein ThiS [Deltaproteobacteria bacterium]